MFGNRITLFSILGFKVSLDLSWLVLLLLLTWSLARGLFPYYFEELPNATYWWMGLIGSIGLFFSIVFHELCHSLVARSYGIPMKGITLFIFGGVAEMDEEPPSAKAEFMMAFAGPLSSFVLGGFAYLVYRASLPIAPVPVQGILLYLALTNIILGIFNLMPAFPLDGGRVLRSILWSWKNNLKWATRISSRIGSFFGVLLIVLGIFSILSGNLLGGVWWFLIGIFVKNAATMSYRQLLTRKALEGEKVSRFMVPNPVTVPPALSISQLVNDYVYRYHYKMFPVVSAGTPVGCVTLNQVKEFPAPEWDRHTVGEISSGNLADTTVAPDTDAVKALSIMNRTGNTRLMVVHNGELVGIVSLKDLLKFLSIKLDLEEESGT